MLNSRHLHFGGDMVFLCSSSPVAGTAARNCTENFFISRTAVEGTQRNNDLQVCSGPRTCVRKGKNPQRNTCILLMTHAKAACYRQAWRGRGSLSVTGRRGSDARWLKWTIVRLYKKKKCECGFIKYFSDTSKICVFKDKSKKNK